MNKDQIEKLEAEILNGLAEIECLEARKTPAVTTFGIAGGILTLNFDGANDTVIVSQDTDTISVAVNDGSVLTAQRSMVRSLTVTFDRPVPLAADTFTLTRRDPGGGAGDGVFLLVATQDGGRTYVLTFPDAGPSLADGVYDLSVPSIPGATRSFHRLFGDADGDGDSDNLDLLSLRTTYLKPSTDPAYLSWWDYDGSGVVDNLDVFQVRSRRSVVFQGY